MPKSGKLSFKGEKDQKKKKRKHKDRDDHDASSSRHNQLTWVLVDNVEDLEGPLFITHPSDPPVCLTVDDDDRFLAYPLPELADLQPGEIEPTIVNQVFVGARMVGTSNSFTFKSCHGKYLSSDKVGVVSCHKEAISGQEEWQPTIVEAGVAFQNVHNKFLMIDENANGSLSVRADADEVGFCETFRVYCQTRFKYRQKKPKKEKVNEGKVERDSFKKFVSHTGGRVLDISGEGSQLRKAKEEGRFQETLLDRREKMKSDRYCK